MNAPIALSSQISRQRAKAPRVRGPLESTGLFWDRYGRRQRCQTRHGTSGIQSSAADAKRGCSKKILRANPCSGVEFPVPVRGLFRPHYVSWSEQKRIEKHAPQHLGNIVRIITETGLRVYKEPMPMKKDQVDLRNAVVRIPDSKTPVPNENALWPGSNLFSANMRSWFPRSAVIVERAGEGLGA